MGVPKRAAVVGDFWGGNRLLGHNSGGRRHQSAIWGLKYFWGGERAKSLIVPSRGCRRAFGGFPDDPTVRSSRPGRSHESYSRALICIDPVRKSGVTASPGFPEIYKLQR